MGGGTTQRTGAVTARRAHDEAQKEARVSEKQTTRGRSAVEASAAHDRRSHHYDMEASSVHAPLERTSKDVPGRMRVKQAPASTARGQLQWTGESMKNMLGGKVKAGVQPQAGSGSTDELMKSMPHEERTRVRI